MTEQITAAQRDALIAAGGCPCTPNPFAHCDTCHRVAIGGAHSAVISYGWVAETIDGSTITRADAPSVEALPIDAVKRIVVLTDDPRIPRVTLDVQPEKGERLWRFRRTAKRADLTSGDGRLVGSCVVEVLEVRNADGWAVRLYLHPQQGPIMSTRDLYF